MKNKNAALPIASALLVILAAVTFVNFREKPTVKTSSVKPEITCANFDEVFNTVKSDLSESSKDLVEDTDSNSNPLFKWKRAATEPTVQYIPHQVKNLIVQNELAPEISKKFEASTTTKLVAQGLVKNDLNFNAYKRSDAVVYGEASYGFQMDDVSFLITIADGESDQLPENGTLVQVMCHNKDAAYDEMYNKIISKNVYTEKNRIGIADIRDSVIYLSVGTVDGFGGHASYWMIKKDVTEQLVKGTQERPLCSIFEQKRVGKGTECYDPVLEDSRVVDF
jgi:hypothetical protein